MGSCNYGEVDTVQGHKHMKYMERNDRQPSVNQIPLVHYHDKAWNKCYTRDNTTTR